MGLTNEQLLDVAVRKAVLESGSDLSFDGANDGDTKGALSVSQQNAFLKLMAAKQAVVPSAQTFQNVGAKWQQNIMESGGRILRPGIESTVGDVAKPALKTVEMSTGFFKGIYAVSDEYFEDTAGNDADASIAAILANQVGADVEDYALNSSDSDTDAAMHDEADAFALLPDGGWVWQVDNGNSTGSGPGFYDASSDGQDYQVIFRQLLTSIPARFFTSPSDFAYWVPRVLEIAYRDALSARGTALGDVLLTKDQTIAYQGIAITPVPLLHVNAAANPDASHILLASGRNLYLGFQRGIRIETWRDPREGFKSWVVTVRFDAKVPVLDAVAAAENVDVEA